jgi:Mce-associated membrane protein
MTEPAADVTQVAAQSTPPEGAGGHSRWMVASVALAVVMAVFLAVVAQRLSSHTSSERHSGSSSAASASYLAGPSARAAMAAATVDLRNILSYNYTTLPADFALAEKGMTTSFRKTYVTTTQNSVSPVAAKTHTISTASVAAAGVQTSSVNAATVLVFADQTVQNTLLANPRLDRSRDVVSMVRINGHWLVSDVKPV